MVVYAAVTPARASDVPALARVLAEAFDDDPVMGWMVPRADTRVVHATRLFTTLTRHLHLAAGGAEVVRDATGALVGAALWGPPGQWHASTWRQLVMLPGLFRALGRRMAMAGEASERMQRMHPAEPHWYLATLGCAPAARGRGFGHALLRSRLERCDAEGMPAYLESSKPENVAYYERFGFVLVGEISLGKGGPAVWPMWREPKNAAWDM